MSVPEDVKNVSYADDIHQDQKKETYGLVGLSTKFDEDVYFGKHSSVWGSFYDTKLKKWGYRCCQSLVKD